jgi:hypothetical protein
MPATDHLFPTGTPAVDARYSQLPLVLVATSRTVFFEFLPHTLISDDSLYFRGCPSLGTDSSGAISILYNLVQSLGPWESSRTVFFGSMSRPSTVGIPAVGFSSRTTPAIERIGCLVVFSCRAAVDTIDALALASHTTLVVDPLSTTSCGSSCTSWYVLVLCRLSSRRPVAVLYLLRTSLAIAPSDLSKESSSMALVPLPQSLHFVVVLLVILLAQPCYQTPRLLWALSCISLATHAL